MLRSDRLSERPRNAAAEPSGSPAPARTPPRLRDRVALAFVLLVTVALVLHALELVRRYGSPMPTRDDLELVAPISYHASFDVLVQLLWAQFNEHRVVLSQLVHYYVTVWARDFRAGGVAQIALYAIAALVCIAAASRLRGRSSWVDALFPLLWLSWGAADNFLLGTQICVALSALLAVVIVVAATWRAGAPSVARIATIGLCTALLPLCGGFGLCQTPAFAGWLVVAGVLLWRAGARGRAAWSFAWVLACAGVIALYFTDFTWPARSDEHRTVGRLVVIAMQLLSMICGQAGAQHPWIAGPITLVVVAGGVAWTVAGLRRGEAERWRALGLAASIAGVGLLAASIGWSRQDAWPLAGWASRYVGAPSPIVVACVLGGLLYANRRLAQAVTGALAIAAALAIPEQVRVGGAAASIQQRIVAPLLQAVEVGTPIDDVARLYYPQFYLSADGFAARLRLLQQERLPPFDRATAPEHAYTTRPEVVASRGEPLERRLSGQPVIGVRAPARLRVPLAPGTKLVFGRVGVLPLAYGPQIEPHLRTGGIEVRVVWAGDDGTERVLHERRLDPVAKPGDRPLAPFFVTVPSEGPGNLFLESASVVRDAATNDWAAWSWLALQ